MESMHYADYANRLNTLHNTLSAISTKGNDQARENARVELLAALESVDRFMKSFEPETTEFRSECNRRVASTNELLSSRTSDGVPISRRILVKAQSSLQEIMNSAASVSMRKSRECVTALDTLAKELKAARDAEITAFNNLENKMNDNNLMDLLHRLREDSEVTHSDASSKIRDSTKRWNTVKTLSNPRPVIEYQEEQEFRSTSISNAFGAGAGGPGGAPDPEKLLRDAGKNIGKVGKTVANLPGKAAKEGVKVMTDTVNTVGSGVVDFATTGANGMVKGVTKFSKAAKSTTEKATGAFFGATDDSSQHSGHGHNGGNSTSGGSNTFLGMDLSGGGGNNSGSSRKKSAGAMSFFNPLDL
jgi:hypothetical protein